VPIQGFGYVALCGTIGALDPRRRLEVQQLVYFNREREVLGPMGLTFEIDDSEPQSRLTVVQDGYGDGPDWDWYYQLVMENWPKALGGLKEYLERPEQP
jgi:hypothetical protein